MGWSPKEIVDSASAGFPPDRKREGIHARASVAWVIRGTGASLRLGKQKGVRQTSLAEEMAFYFPIQGFRAWRKRRVRLKGTDVLGKKKCGIFVTAERRLAAKGIGENVGR